MGQNATFRNTVATVAGDDHAHVEVPATVGAGLALGFGVGLVVLAVAGTIILWPSAGTAGRVLLGALTTALLTFAGVVAAYQAADLRELFDRVTFNSERRTLLLQRLESALDYDLDGDGIVGTPEEAPRFVPVKGKDFAGAVNLGGAADDMLGRLLALVDAIAKVGTLSRRRVLPLIGGDQDSRWLYDHALGTGDTVGVLPALGLVQGRGPRSTGTLTYGPEEVKSILRRAWQGDYDKALMSTKR